MSKKVKVNKKQVKIPDWAYWNSKWKVPPMDQMAQLQSRIFDKANP